jgi:pimeloyl-ACP methyl ester carboxylesterase
MSFRGLSLTLAFIAALACEAGCSSSPSPPPAPDAGVQPATLPIEMGVYIDGKPVTEMVYGQAFAVRIDHVPPGKAVSLYTRQNGQTKGRALESLAVFAGPASGVVDTSLLAPTTGTYQGVDSDGIVWSMADAEAPADLGTDPFALYITAVVDEQPVASVTLPRLATKRGVKRISVQENGLVGVYYLPEAPKEGSLPAPILAFGGSEGGLFAGEWYASLFASWGYPTLGVAYFGEPGVPADLKNVPLEYFAKAIQWLKARPELPKDRLAVIGGSRGGELALRLGATFPEITAVVAEVPSSHLWGDAWTYEGASLPFLEGDPNFESPKVKMPNGKSAYLSTPGFVDAFSKSTPAQLDAAATRVERTQGPVLLLGGADDQIWPSCFFGERAMERLQAAKHTAKYKDEFICFPDAGHSVSFPGGSTTTSMWIYHPVIKVWFASGGSAQGNAHAQRAADTKLHGFFDANLR